MANGKKKWRLEANKLIYVVCQRRVRTYRHYYVGDIVKDVFEKLPKVLMNKYKQTYTQIYNIMYFHKSFIHVRVTERKIVYIYACLHVCFVYV